MFYLTKIAENIWDYYPTIKTNSAIWLLSANMNDQYGINYNIYPKNQAVRIALFAARSNFNLTQKHYSFRKIYRLQHIRQLSPDTYVLRFDRNGMNFRAGQHITLGIPGNNQVREYSIYSTEQDTSLEVLIKEVDNGLVSKQLRKLIPGELLEVDGPFGYFTIDEQHLNVNFCSSAPVPELLRFAA